MEVRTASNVDLKSRARVRRASQPLLSFMGTSTPKFVQSSLMIRPDRRCHKRHSVKAGAMAMFCAGPSRLADIRSMSMGEIGIAMMAAAPTKMGQIIDIGMGGLAFHYVARRKMPSAEIEDFRLDLLVAAERYFLSGLTFEIVSDRGPASHNPSPLHRGIIALRFDALSEYQHAALKKFIQNFTID